MNPGVPRKYHNPDRCLSRTAEHRIRPVLVFLSQGVIQVGFGLVV